MLGQSNIVPPSTIHVCPVINADFGDAQKDTN